MWPVGHVRRPPAGARGCARLALGSDSDRARRGVSGALNPQSALAGLNSLPRGFPSRSPRRLRRRWLGSRAVSAREPGQVRKEAALSDPRQAQRGLPDRSLVWRTAAGVRSLDEGCTVRYALSEQPGPARGCRAAGVRSGVVERGLRLGALTAPHEQRLKITHERFAAARSNPGGTLTGRCGSWGSST